MSTGKFWILVVLSLIIAVFIVLEMRGELVVGNLSSELSANQARIAQAQQRNQVLRQLIQSMATESQNDPALANVLNKHGIHFTFPSQGQGATNAVSSPAPVGPATPAPTSHAVPK